MTRWFLLNGAPKIESITRIYYEELYVEKFQKKKL